MPFRPESATGTLGRGKGGNDWSQIWSVPNSPSTPCSACGLNDLHGHCQADDRLLGAFNTPGTAVSWAIWQLR